MASDEELNQRIRIAERQQERSDPVDHRLAEMETTARSVHNELARRIEAVDERSVASGELVAIREEIARLETRLGAIEARLD